MEPKACIVCPTLNAYYAASTLERAATMAGVPTMSVMVRDFTKRGGVKPSNIAFKAALATNVPYIAYWNDDCDVNQSNWLKRLIEALESDEHYGIAAPGGPCNSVPQRDGKPGLPPAVVEVNSPLAWFCACVKRAVFETTGLFDEAFTHYADESDFEKRAWLKGWKSVYVQDVYVHHAKGPRIDEWWEKDVALYHRRWG